MINRKAVGYACIFMIFTLFGLNHITRPEITLAQSFPNQAGFPRFEPRNTITFGSPTVVDIDNDGELDILLPDGNGCVWAWDHTGAVLPNYPLETGGSCQGTPRISGPLAVGDVDGDGKLEIAAGTRGTGDNVGQRGRVFLWNHNGSLVSGWPKEMAWNTQYGSGLPEVMTVAMANIIGDARLEIVAGTSNNASSGGTPDDPTHNLYAYQANGNVLSGFPTQHLRAGIWGFVGLADLDGNGYAEILAARDHRFISTYNNQGTQLTNWPIETRVDPVNQPNGLFIEFTRDAPSVADIDNDGTVEIVIVGKVRNPSQSYNVTNSAILVLQPNGQREPGWAVAKLTGSPLYNDYHPTQSPALADLNGDGTLEIVVTLLDGTIRAYQVNGSLLWQYNFAQGHRLFASEPVIGDVSGDGQVDIVFGTYSPDGSDDNQARLHGLNASGQPLAGFPLTLGSEGGASKKGVRAAPTLADIDGDCDVEILVGSQGGVLYVWDLPAPYYPSLMPWPTARHDFQRTGFVEALFNEVVPPSNANFSPGSLYLPLLANDYGGC
jgi:hypothetical protein